MKNKNLMKANVLMSPVGISIIIGIVLLVLGLAFAYSGSFSAIKKAENLDGDNTCVREDISVSLSGNVIVVDDANAGLIFTPDFFRVEPVVESISGVSFNQLSFFNPEPFDYSVEIFDATTNRKVGSTFRSSSELGVDEGERLVPFDIAWKTEACSFDKIDLDMVLKVTVVETDEIQFIQDIEQSTKTFNVNVRDGSVVSVK